MTDVDLCECGPVVCGENTCSCCPQFCCYDQLHEKIYRTSALSEKPTETMAASKAWYALLSMYLLYVLVSVATFEWGMDGATVYLIASFVVFGVLLEFLYKGRAFLRGWTFQRASEPVTYWMAIGSILMFGIVVAWGSRELRYAEKADRVEWPCSSEKK